jgi:hypothetical protein
MCLLQLHELPCNGVDRSEVRIDSQELGRIGARHTPLPIDLSCLELGDLLKQSFDLQNLVAQEIQFGICHMAPRKPPYIYVSYCSEIGLRERSLRALPIHTTSKLGDTGGAFRGGTPMGSLPLLLGNATSAFIASHRGSAHATHRGG